MKVISFGEILWDIIDGKEHLGGAPLNFAAHAAQCGMEATIVSRLGVDARGVLAYNSCKEYQVNTNNIQWDENHPTGTVDVRLTNGQPDYTIHTNVAYDYIDAERFADSTEITTDVFYFGSLIQRHATSANCLYHLVSKLKCKYIFYDVNLRKESYTEDVIKKSLAICNVFKLNVDELPTISKALTGEVLEMDRFLRQLVLIFPNLKVVIITAADKGCYTFDGTRLTHVPGVKVVVADAVGAGDAFSAAFMYGLLSHGDAIKAASMANLIGAFVASKNGAIPQYTSEIKSQLQRT